MMLCTVKALVSLYIILFDSDKKLNEIKQTNKNMYHFEMYQPGLDLPWDSPTKEGPGYATGFITSKYDG